MKKRTWNGNIENIVMMRNVFIVESNFDKIDFNLKVETFERKKKNLNSQLAQWIGRRREKNFYSIYFSFNKRMAALDLTTANGKKISKIVRSHSVSAQHFKIDKKIQQRRTGIITQLCSSHRSHCKFIRHTHLQKCAWAKIVLFTFFYS